MAQMTGENSSRPNYKKLSVNDATNSEDIGDDVEGDAESGQCGIGKLRCRCLQVFAHPNVFVVLLGLLFMTYVASTGIYLAGVISTIEKRFKLKSSESGVLVAMNDISSLCGVLFVSYFGGKSHRPRIIAVSSIAIGLGCLMTALPQFLYVNSELQELFVNSNNQSNLMKGTTLFQEEYLCSARGNESTECTTAELEASGSQLSKAWPIIVGQLLAGFGSSAILPLGIAYLDDAVDKTLVPMYLVGIFLPMAFAPLLGFVLSGYCLSIFSDYYKTDAAELGITPKDPQWQGAWWLGFIIYAVIEFILSALFFLFPRKMSKPKTYCCRMRLADRCKGVMGGRETSGDRMDMKEVRRSSSNISGKPAEIAKDFIATLWRLVTNATYMLSSMGFTFIVISFSGFGIFGAKYIQFQFGLDPARAGMLLGFVIMPGSLIGIILGGVITSRLAGNKQGYATLTVILQSISFLAFFILMLVGCQNEDIAGISSKYREDGGFSGGESQALYTPCNMNCTCEKGVYSPVCGDDNVTYITACFAGCKTFEKDQNNNTVHMDCSCMSTLTEKMPLNESTSGAAASGACPPGCQSLMPYLVIVCITLLMVTLGYNSAFMLRFRTVAIKDREVAIGLSSFISKILGFIPAPIIFGGAIDSQCLYWQETCNKTGECMLYDRPGLRFVYFGLIAGFRFFGALCFCVLLYCVVKNKTAQEPEEDDGIGEERTDEVQVTEMGAQEK